MNNGIDHRFARSNIHIFTKNSYCSNFIECNVVKRINVIIKLCSERDGTGKRLPKRIFDNDQDIFSKYRIETPGN